VSAADGELAPLTDEPTWMCDPLDGAAPPRWPLAALPAAAAPRALSTNGPLSAPPARPPPS